MSKDKDLLSRFGGNLAESMGAGRTPRGAVPGSPPAESSGTSRHDGCSRLKAAAEIAVDRIVPDPNQPRSEFETDALDRLASSLTSHGQLQPISVRWSDDVGRYLIVTGERRWRASVRAGRPTIAAVIVEGTQTESQILEMQLIENAMREDLQPIEQARAFRTLMERNGWTAARLAEVLHLTGATVSRAMALLELPGAVQAAIESGELAPSVAYEVSKLEDPAAQAEVADRAVAEGMNRAEVVRAVRARSTSKPKGRGGKPRKVTERTFRFGGYRLVVENRRGIEADGLRAALVEALGQLDAERSEAAA
jgi:ParB family chromosome partitioning protein